MDERPPAEGRLVSISLALGVGLAVAVGLPAVDSSAASLAVVLAVTGRSTNLRGLSGSILVGALALAVVGWLGAGLLEPDVSRPLVAGLGVAVGGGLGAVVWLLAVGDGSDEGRRTVDIDMDAEEGAGSEPRPADLFAASPDPIVFFAGHDKPVVRAVNPAFEDVFGTATATLEDAPLAEALPVESGDEALLDAARAGESHDDVFECTTADGSERMRIRLAPTSDEGASGYVLYTPIRGGER